MSIGTAIFLSSLVLATVVLYGITKDRWRRARFATGARNLLAGAILVAAVIGALAIISKWFPVSPGPQTVCGPAAGHQPG
jgi:ABC-type nickel/cobalt efflux system permease component RcnA